MGYKFIWIFIIGICMVLSSSCATITPQQQAALQESVPMCIGARDCEAKWAAARKWVLNTARSKIQIYSDDLIETYNPAPDSPLLAARITKEPTVTGTYLIVPKVWCNNMFGCVPKIADALMDFNNYVNSVVVQDDSVYIDALKKNKYLKPIMGASLSFVNSKVIVKTIFSGSPADKGGMKTQDIITQFAGNNVYDMESLLNMIGSVNHGDEIEIIVMRESRRVPLKLKFPTENELNKIKESDGSLNTTIDPNDIETKIKTLARLLEDGLITQDEFNEKKAKLLEKY